MLDKITSSVSTRLLCTLGFTFCLASRLLMAQNPMGQDPSFTQGLSSGNTLACDVLGMNDVCNPAEAPKYRLVAGRVMSLRGDIIPGAVVLVSPMMAGEYRVFETDASGDFQTLYYMKRWYASEFRVWLTVKKKGFQTAHELIDYSEFPNPIRLSLTLRREHPNPALLSQQDLLSELLPRLRSLKPSDGIAAKSQQKYAKGVLEFADKRRPDRALSAFSDVVKSNPQCVKCRTMLALAELDSGNWDGAARRVDSIVAPDIKNKTGGNPEAMVLAGVMESWMHRPQSAVAFFARVNSLEPGNKLVLQELGRAYLQLRQFELADASLEKSLAAGGGPEARQLRVQALLGEDKVDEANVEMDRYVKGRDINTLPLEVRILRAQVLQRKRVETAYAGSHQVKKKTGEVVSIDYLHNSARQPLLKGIEPAKSQDDLKNILMAVGKNVGTLFHGFQNSTSLETIRQKQLRHNGKVSKQSDEKFRYLCLLPEDPATPGFTEYRQNVNSARGVRGGLKHGYMLTSGFASAALTFHPQYQSESQFRYLGRQMIGDHETYVIAFAQIPAKASRIGIFKSGEKSDPILEQGLAWIDTQNYQVIRLRTDLLKPLPDVQLKKVTTQIDYHEVHIKQLAQTLWLPTDVTVTVDWRGKTLQNEHHYSDFKLFNVHTSETIGNPKALKESTRSQPSAHRASGD